MRLHLATVGAGAALVLGAGAASAVGTPDVDLSPVPAVVHGRPVTSFHVDLPSHGHRDAQYLLRSKAGRPQAVRVYATTAYRSATGAFSLSTESSSPYVQLQPYSVTLQPGERRLRSFRVALRGQSLPKEQQYAALVLEVRQGSIVQRVATIIYLKPVKTLDLPVAAVVAAALLIALLALALLLVAQRRRRAPVG